MNFQDFIKEQALKANAVVRNEPYTGFANDSLKRNYPVFGQSDADIANAKFELQLNLKKVKLGFLTGVLTLIWLVITLIPENLVSSAVYSLALICVASIVCASIVDRLNLLDSQMQTLEECEGCPEMLELRTNSVVVAQYVDTVINHRQLYCFDLQVAHGLAKLEKAQVAAHQSAEKNRQACVALHSGLVK